jgi:hypothetical protein
VALLVVLVVSVAAVVLVMRAAAAPGGARRKAGGGRAVRSQRPTGSNSTARPVAPDDDPEFLRELARRVRRDDYPA